MRVEHWVNPAYLLLVRSVMNEGAVPGLPDVSRVVRWLRERGMDVPGRVDHVEIIAGGRSNLTYRLDFGRPRREEAGTPVAPPAGIDRNGGTGTLAQLVLRRPPLGHVLPTAHDMAREYRVLEALHGTQVPVPRPVALCTDSELIGAPFYVMEHVEGMVLRRREDAAGLAEQDARALSHTFAGMLATIHDVDVAAVGLADFGRPRGYLARQLARWQRQWDLSVTRPMPGYAELVPRLTAGLPSETDDGNAAGVLVHGDFRLDNMLVVTEPRPRVAAVLDWEMSTLGDPLADLGLSLVYWAEPGEQDLLAFSAGASVTTAPGFLRRAEVADAYARVTGRDLSRLGYYMAFGCFKLAVVLEGIHARYLQRKTVGEGFEREGQAVPALIGRAHQLLDGEA